MRDKLDKIIFIIPHGQPNKLLRLRFEMWYSKRKHASLFVGIATNLILAPLLRVYVTGILSKGTVYVRGKYIVQSIVVPIVPTVFSLFFPQLSQQFRAKKKVVKSKLVLNILSINTMV